MKRYEIDAAMVGDEQITESELRAMAVMIEGATGVPTKAVWGTFNGASNTEDIPEDAWTAALEAIVTRRASAVMGRKGGSVRSERKTAAVRENGKKGGRPRSTRAVTIRCVKCGLRLTGVMHVNGTLHASDRSRPAPDAPEQDGLCASCAETV
jgi:hypothetical protein